MADHIEKTKIKSVSVNEDSYTIQFINNSGFGLDKKYQVMPKEDDDIEIICVGGYFGTIRGVTINGVKVFYKTDEDLENERIAYKKAQEEKEKAAFEREKENLDKRYSKLPEIFRQRIDRFRRNNPDFRVKFESYELFCCEEAMIIAKACKTAEVVQKYNNLGYTKQKLMTPKLSKGHSGNTFGMSVRLAYWYLQQPENVVNHHGALSALVGSEAYGDIDPEEKTEENNV